MPEPCLTLDLMERTFDAKKKDQFSFDNLYNLKATGNEPFWGLIIDQESILFKSLIERFEILNFPRTVPLSNQNWDLMTLISQPETGTIKVDIRRADCIDNMSGVIHPSQVKVSIKRGNDSDFKVFEGCGKNTGNKDLRLLRKIVT